MSAGPITWAPSGDAEPPPCGGSSNLATQPFRFLGRRKDGARQLKRAAAIMPPIRIPDTTVAIAMIVG